MFDASGEPDLLIISDEIRLEGSGSKTKRNTGIETQPDLRCKAVELWIPGGYGHGLRENLRAVEVYNILSSRVEGEDIGLPVPEHERGAGLCRDRPRQRQGRNRREIKRELLFQEAIA